MDELSALPPEGTWKRAPRIRTSSLNPRYAYTNPSPSLSAHRGESPLHTSAYAPASPMSATTDLTQQDGPLVILAPTPRRHLLESSASQHWLNTPSPLSPMSSRPVSPQSQQGDPTTPSATSSAFSSTHVRRRISSTNRRSISAILLENDDRTKNLAQTVLTAKHRAKAQEPEETATGRRWIRWMHKCGQRQWVVPGVIAATTLIKLAIGLGSYSGYGTPPMFGDYEAQRHWMELTTHLSFKDWYSYDLPYWGLDYPPLTAYVSWICGLVAHWLNPSWVALNFSRGIETPESKLFMRLTVIVWDALVYVPALIMFARTWQGSRSHRTQELAILTLSLQPALLLIDFGHFQYNSVMLGLTLLSINFLATGQDLVAAFFFVLSLGFKQMALYYAPAIGAYFLARCLYLGPVKGARLFVNLALVTLSTFTVLFLPWLPPFASLPVILQPIRRIFPFARGLFEDKVSNFWCASNVVIKWKVWASSSLLLKLSTAITALGFFPSVIGLLRAGATLSPSASSEKPTDAGTEERPKPTPFLPLLPYALLSSSMSFFLFSFQVHEKTILLPLMPITLLLSAAPVDSAVYSWGVLANNAAVFSMWPLLKKDGLGAQYIATLLLWNRIIGHNPTKLRFKSFIEIFSTLFYAGAFLLHIVELFASPPARYPDIYPVLNVLVSTPVFFLVWLWSIKCGVEVGWTFSGLGHGHRTERKTSGNADGMTASASAPHQGAANGSFRQTGGRTVSDHQFREKRFNVGNASNMPKEVERLHVAEISGGSDCEPRPDGFDLLTHTTTANLLLILMSLLPSAARTTPRRVCVQVVFARSYATETVTTSHSPSDLPPPPLSKPKANRPRLYPHPRPATSHRHSPLPNLPSSFGRNQLLPVSNSTRALLESIVAGFDAPIRYAFAYGSGVFEQDGYTLPTSSPSSSSPVDAASKNKDAPMLDFMFAVTHPAHFHSINMHQHPNHYPLHSRVLGSSYVSKVQDVGPGVWFNAYVPMQGVTIKYGVTTVDNLCSDLLNWRTLYLAGRMHKPLRIIKDDARVRLTQQVNLTSAVRAALLTLPEEFTENELFERIAGISYTGDPRMLLPAENRGKVGNIVRKQSPQFKELYHRLVVGLPGVHWPLDSSVIQQDISARTRSAHLRKLPSNLLTRVKNNYSRNGTNPELEADEAAYWMTLAGDAKLPQVLTQEMSGIVRYPATVQSIKGLASVGVTKSLRYSTAKIGKWWSGS